MLTALELIREGRTRELWERCCGFIDLDIEQFMEIQERLLLEQIEAIHKCELGKKLFRGTKPSSVQKFREQVPLTTYGDYIPYLSEKMDDSLPDKPLFWQRTSGRSDEYSCKWGPIPRGFYEGLGSVLLAVLIFSSCEDRYHVVLKEHDKLLYGLAPPPYTSGTWARRLA